MRIMWENKICQDRDSTVKGLEEIHREEIFTRKGKEGMIQEEGNTIEGIIEESLGSQETSQET